MNPLRGTGVSPGIAVGRALVMERDAAPVFRLSIEPERVEERRPAGRAASASDGTAVEVTRYVDKRFRVGATVFHPTYGEGIIKSVEGSGRDMKVNVYFAGHGEKKFLVAYAPFRFA